MECALPRFKKQSYVFRRPWYLRLKILDQEVAAEIVLANGHSIETHVRPSFVMTLTLYPSSLQAKNASYQIFGCVCHVMWWIVLQFCAQSIKSPLHVTVDWIHCIWQLAWRRKRLVLMQGWHLKRRSSDACYGLVHPSESKLYNYATTIKMNNYIVVLCAA